MDSDGAWDEERDRDYEPSPDEMDRVDPPEDWPDPPEPDEEEDDESSELQGA